MLMLFRNKMYNYYYWGITFLFNAMAFRVADVIDIIVYLMHTNIKPQPGVQSTLNCINYFRQLSEHQLQINSRQISEIILLHKNTKCYQQLTQRQNHAYI